MTVSDKLKENKNHRSLSGILLFNFLIFFMIIFFILAAASGYIMFLHQQKIIFSQQRFVAQEAADIVRYFINEKFIAMETTARLVNPALISGEILERNINSLFGAHLSFRHIILKNRKKQSIVDKTRLSYVGSRVSLNNRLHDDLYRITELGKRYISDVYVDTRTSEPIVFIAVPVKDYFGDIHGTLIVELNLKFIWDLVESITIGKTGVAYIVDRQGKLIAFHDVSRVLQSENIGNLKVVHEFMKNQGSKREDHTYIFSGITGKLVIGSYVPLGEPDFAVVTEQSIFETYNSLIQMGILFLAFSITIWGLIVIISIRLARHLSIPLVNLMNISGRIAGGERGLRAELNGPIEIVSMAKAFNSMTAQLNDVIENLEHRSEYLQTTVQKYVEYMAKVGNGQLDTFLTIEEKKDEINDPLIILGQQLNDTTQNLNIKIRQIQETTDKLKMNEEKLLIYSNQLEKSNKELEQFAYIVSHDLQEPLRKLKFFSDRLKKNYSTLIDENGIEYLNSIMNAAVRMENLIKGLLKYSRITTKAKPFEKVDLNEIIEGVIDDLEIRIKETHAEISTENLPVIDADPLQMRQLFQNLIGNAIKYIRKDVAPVVKINANIKSNDKNFCEIKIIDNGIGFEEKYKEEIFGLFKRLYGRNEYEGTGLGLAICKKIVEQHRGIINATGKPGEGSTFYISLPLEQKTAE